MKTKLPSSRDIDAALVVKYGALPSPYVLSNAERYHHPECKGLNFLPEEARIMDIRQDTSVLAGLRSWPSGQHRGSY